MINHIILYFDTGFIISGFKFNDGWDIQIGGVSPSIERVFNKLYGEKRFKRLYDLLNFIRNFTEAKLTKVEVN